jgi:probable HAF family extracellular repeat protein
MKRCIVVPLLSLISILGMDAQIQPARPVPANINLGFGASVSWSKSLPHNGIDYASTLGNQIASVGPGGIISPSGFTKPDASRFGSIDPDHKGPAIWMRYSLATGEPIYVLYGHTAASWNDLSSGIGTASFKFDCTYSVGWKGQDSIGSGVVVGRTAPFYNHRLLVPHLHVSVFKPNKSCHNNTAYCSVPSSGWGYSKLNLPTGDYINPEDFFTKPEYALLGGASTGGTITANATLDGTIWNSSAEAPIRFSVVGGPNNQILDSTTVVPFNSQPALAAGSYTLGSVVGGPPNSRLIGVSPCAGPLVTSCTTSLSSGGTLPFVLIFATNPPTAGFTITLTSTGQSINEGQTLTVTASVGSSASVNISGTRSMAFNSTIASWQWTIDGAVTSTATGNSFPHTFGVGSHAVSLIVIDGRGVQSTPATGTIIVTQSASIMDLGSLGGQSAGVYGINNAGQAVGAASTGQFGGGGAICGNGQCPIGDAALWSPGSPPQNLGLPPGAFGIDSVANAINGIGQVVGNYSYPGYFGGAFLYSNGVTTDPLNGVPGNATGINNSAELVGAFSITGGAFDTYHAFLKTGSTLTDLGTLGGAGSSQASGLNNIGQVVGTAPLPGNAASHAFLYSGALPLYDLGTLEGVQSSALAINDAGQVVGWAYTATAQHAFLYAGSLPLRDLGTLGGANSQAEALNKSTQIVGWAETPSGEQRAFLWNAGQMIDLNGLFTLGQGATLKDATGINDGGQIAANGSDGHAYLLALPFPVPPVIMSSSTGTVSIGQPAPFPVSLSAPAQAAVTIYLSSSDTSEATVTPASVTIAIGATKPGVTPQVNGVNLGGATITASAVGYASIFQKIQVTDIVYSQTAYDASTPSFCMVNPTTGAQLGACGPFVSNWFEPTGNPPGRLASVTLKLQMQGHNEFNAWDCYWSPGVDCGSPGDFGGIFVYSTQIANGCSSTNSIRAVNFTQDTWQDVTFLFDPSCPIDFSQGHQLWDIQRTSGVPWGWGMAYSTDGQIYAIIRSQ